VANKVVLNKVPGMEPAISGRVLLRYGGVCGEAAIHDAGTTFEIPVDPAPASTDTVMITTLQLHDECGTDVALDTTASPSFCHGIAFYNPQAAGNWPIECDAGYGTE
jgi:hypothetical protein